MTQAEVWLARVGGKTRPVVILTRPEVIDVRTLVTVAEITSSVRGIAAEVELDHAELGLDRPSVINCDGLHTIPRSRLERRVGAVDDQTMALVCSSVTHAIGC